jgi:lysyl-tRNA synthetase class 2
MSENPDDNEQRDVRLAKRERLLADGGQAYPVGVRITHTIPQVRAEWGHLQADDTTDATVAIAGRVVFQRNTGKLCFATLQAGDGSRIQAMISLAQVGEQSLERWKELVDLGDIVQVEGEVISSKRGELSVLADTWQIAS